MESKIGFVFSGNFEALVLHEGCEFIVGVPMKTIFIINRIVCHPTDITHSSSYLSSGFSAKFSYQLGRLRGNDQVHTPNCRVQRAQLLGDPVDLVLDGLHHLGTIQRYLGVSAGRSVLKERAFLDGTRDVVATRLMRRIVGGAESAEDSLTGVSRHVDESSCSAERLEFESSLENSQLCAP